MTDETPMIPLNVHEAIVASVSRVGSEQLRKTMRELVGIEARLAYTEAQRDEAIRINESITRSGNDADDEIERLRSKVEESVTLIESQRTEIANLQTLLKEARKPR